MGWGAPLAAAFENDQRWEGNPHSPLRGEEMYRT
jgi:hypothetical protein